MQPLLGRKTFPLRRTSSFHNRRYPQRRRTWSRSPLHERNEQFLFHGTSESAPEGPACEREETGTKSRRVKHSKVRASGPVFDAKSCPTVGRYRGACGIPEPFHPGTPARSRASATRPG
jgi:hypothetical protein